MAAANLPLIYKPLLDDDGIIDDAFHVLSHYSYLIGNPFAPHSNGVSWGYRIIHQSTEIIKYRDGKFKLNDDGSMSRGRGFPVIIFDCKNDLDNLMQTTKFRELLHVFDIFSKPEFEHHPFHYHKSILLGVEAQMKFYLTEAINLFDILEKMALIGEDIKDQMEQRIFTAEYMLYSLLPQLQKIAKTIRKLIIISQDGYYSKIHASSIAMLYRKNSKERLHLITQMVQNKCVPSKKALYEVINTRENGLMFVEEEWSKGGGRKEYGCVQSSCLEEDNKCFLGRFELALIPVDQKGIVCIHKHNVAATKTMEIHFPPKPVYICDHIGKNKEQRFYFSPIQFPTPNDLMLAGTGDVFESLKSYIEYASEKGGSPVVCRSYKPGCKKFVCKHSKNCKFSFLVKWDMIGYYIHLYNYDFGYIGCEIHNHNRVLATPYVKFGCDYCKVTYHRLADALEHEKSCKEQARSKRHFPFLAKDAFKKRLKVSCDRTITLIELEKSKK